MGRATGAARGVVIRWPAGGAVFVMKVRIYVPRDERSDISSAAPPHPLEVGLRGLYRLEIRA